MVFGHKTKPQVDLSDFSGEKDPLYNFLQTKTKADIIKIQNRWQLDSENLTPQELHRVVNKYVYHHNLNTKYYVSLKGSIVKLEKFKRDSKPEKTRKNPQSPTFAHGF